MKLFLSLFKLFSELLDTAFNTVKLIHAGITPLKVDYFSKFGKSRGFKSVIFLDVLTFDGTFFLRWKALLKLCFNN